MAFRCVYSDGPWGEVSSKEVIGLGVNLGGPGGRLDVRCTPKARLGRVVGRGAAGCEASERARLLPAMVVVVEYAWPCSCAACTEVLCHVPLLEAMTKQIFDGEKRRIHGLMQIQA